MGWFSGTPRWYDIVMKTLGTTQDSGLRSEAYDLDDISRAKLEEVRKRMGLDHDDFAFLYSGCKTVTAKLQRIIYRKLKNTAPPGTPENEILSRLLASRLRGVEPHVDHDTYLSWEREFAKASEKIHTLDDAVRFICSLSDQTDILPFREIRKEIDLILGGSHSTQ